MKLRNEIVKQAIRDFVGSAKIETTPIMKYMLKRNKPTLTDEQKAVVWYVKENLKDKGYYKALSDSVLNQLFPQDKHNKKH